MEDDVDRALRDHGARLADAVEAVLPAWVARCVGGVADPTDAARAAVADVVPRLRELLARDVDDQQRNPLAVLRDAVRYPTAVLRAAGVEPRPRSAYDEEHFPDDVYALTPMTWRDLDESLHEPGLVWGALKARASIARHRR